MPKPGSFAATAVALAAALCAAPAFGAPPVYTIVPLTLLRGDPASQTATPNAINKNGDITGTITQYVTRRGQTTQNSYAVVWPADGSAPIKLNTPQPETPNDNAIAWAINSSRSVAGMNVNYQGSNHYPQRWIGKKVTALQTPGFGQALAIGDDNTVVGYTQITEKYDNSQPNSTFAVATIWAPDGTPTAVGNYPGFIGAINASGAMIGNLDPGGYKTPFLRSPTGTMTTLRDLPGQAPTYSTYAWTMNDNNETVGTCTLQGATIIGKVGCIWSADGTPMDMGRINDGHGSNEQREYTAWGINNARQVTGYYTWTDINTNKSTTAYTLWTAETGWLPILSLIDPADPLLASATANQLNIRAINNDGVILGQIGLSKAVKLVPKK